jgi:hypothetical protein
VSRKLDDAHRSPGEQPRCRQVTVSEEDRDRIERHLERMPATDVKRAHRSNTPTTFETPVANG